MKKIKENIFYYYLVFLVFALPLVPKDLGTIAGIIPTRLLLLAGIFIIYFYELIKNKRKMVSHNKIVIFLFALLCLTFIPGFFISKSKIIYLYTLAKVLSFILFIYVVYGYNLTKKQVSKLINYMIIVSLFVSLIAIVQYAFNISLNYNGIYKYPGAVGRVSATFFNPIYLAIYLLIINVLSYMGLIKNGNFLKYASIFFINTIAIFITFTRTVAVILIINLFMFLLCSILRKNKKEIMKSTIVLLMTIILVVIIPGVKYLYSSTLVSMFPTKISKPLLSFANDYLNMNFDLKMYGFDEKKDNNIDNPDEPSKPSEIDHDKNNQPNNNTKPDKDKTIDDASLNSRIAFKNIARKVISKNKLFGVGLGNYEKYVLSNKDDFKNTRFGYPHNFIIHLQAESGIFAKTIFLVIYISFFVYIFMSVLIEYNISNFSILVICFDILILMFYESLFFDTQLSPIILLAIVLCLKESTKDRKTNMFISSVGGHLTQLLQLDKLFSKNDYVLITEQTDVTNALTKKYNVEFLPYGSRNQKVLYPFILLANCFISLFYLIKYNPDVIITTGANTAAAMCCLGRLFGKKVIYIESFAKNDSPTITGKMIYKLHAYTTFVVQWENMLKYYPKAEYWGWIY